MRFPATTTGRLVGLVPALAWTLALAPPALAAETEEAPLAAEDEAPLLVAAVEAGAVTASTSAEGAEEEEDLLPVKLGLAITESIGVGTFVSGDQRQALAVMVIDPTVTYPITDDGLSVQAWGRFLWYQTTDYETTYKNDKFIWADPYLRLSHSKIFHDDDLGLSIGAMLTIYGGASLASQMETRRFTLRPGVTLNWDLAPVTISYGLHFAKYFNESTRANLDCSDFEDGKCPEGRGSGPGPYGSFDSEGGGGAFTLPGRGVTSFYVLNTFKLSVEIVEGLTAALDVIVYNFFGYSNYDLDDRSSPNARAGRNQTDRLITGLSLDYQVVKQLSIGLGVTTDTVRPLGDDGKDLVLFGFSRAPTNLTTLDINLVFSF